MTNMLDHVFKRNSMEEATALEEENAVRLARAAAATQGLEHYILSSRPSATDLGARADKRIRAGMPELAAKMTSLVFGFYPSNFTTGMFKPYEVPGARGKHLLLLPCSPNAGIEVTGDMAVNPGIWVRQILANPEKTLGGYTSISAEYCTYGDMLKIWSEVTGRPAAFVSCSLSDYEGLWGGGGKEIGLQLKFNESVRDWLALVKDKHVSKEELGITSGEIKGFRHALEVIKESL
ncbi:hypothetical protein QQX98_006968 [Neonectria punicea]|uniref:NmrA-like domain-containing protein n=1 Tax=Neonectria punicea TaxID=979145 RepID=A0ABR1GZX4_9HYPO